MKFWIIIGYILLATNVLFSQLKYKQGDIIFIKNKAENFRLSPNGTVICKLPQAAKLTVVGEQGSWVAVQIIGWIWKASLTDDITKIPGYSMRALHILVSTEEAAKQIITDLKNGKNFAELAKEKSKGPNAQKGGDLGIIQKGDLLEELDSAIRKLKNGEISGIVKSELGFHIFKRID